MKFLFNSSRLCRQIESYLGPRVKRNDVAICWGHRRWRRIRDDPAIKHYIALECGFFPHYDTIQISVNSGLQQFSHWFADRPEFHGTEKPVVDTSKPILLCGQMPGDAMLRDRAFNPFAWTYRDMIRQIHQGNPNVVYRPHPRLVRRNKHHDEAELCNRLGIPLSYGTLDWSRYQAIATINSSVGVEAIQRGIPVIALGWSVYSMPGISAFNHSREGSDLHDFINGEYLDYIQPDSHRQYIDWLLAHQYPQRRIERRLLKIIKELD